MTYMKEEESASLQDNKATLRLAHGRVHFTMGIATLSMLMVI